MGIHIMTPLYMMVKVKKQLTFQAYGGYKGYLYRYGADYSAVHNAASANTVYAGTSFSLIQGQAFIEYPVSVWTYRIYRAVCAWNTASIPDAAVITKATLRVRTAEVYTDNAYNIVVVQGLFSLPPVAADYGNLLVATGARGSVPASSLVVGEDTDIELNATGRSEINKTGYTRFALRSSREINSDPPGSGAKEYCVFIQLLSRILLIVDYTL